MTDQLYAITQDRLIKAAGALGSLDLEGFLGRITGVHTSGPVIDPTKYRLALARLELIESLARAAQTVAEVHDRLQRLVLDEEVKKFEKEAHRQLQEKDRESH